MSTRGNTNIENLDCTEDWSRQWQTDPPSAPRSAVHLRSLEALSESRSFGRRTDRRFDRKDPVEDLVVVDVAKGGEGERVEEEEDRIDYLR